MSEMSEMSKKNISEKSDSCLQSANLIFSTANAAGDIPVSLPTCRSRVSQHRSLRSPAHIYNRLRAGCYHTPIPAHRVVVNELLTPALSSAGLGSCGSGI